MSRFQLTLMTLLLGAGSTPAAKTPNSAEKLFATKVLPLLQAKCFACHGDDSEKLRGQLDLRSRAGMLAGGESGKPVLVPGNPERSPILRAVAWEGLKMPPKENDRLSAEEIGWLREWVAAGAPWPSKEDIARLRQSAWSEPDAKGGVRVTTSGGQTKEWTERRYDPADLWAWRPVHRPAIPLNAVGHPVDAFLNQKLAAAGIEAAGRADRRTLIRRVTFDLIGLPPTPEEVAAFVNDDSADAYAKLIDRLLASPRYAEQAARLWLDVTRYADSAGFSNDFERPHAWRYRDYVIRSFNNDKPFDRFIVEQIAGDELDASDPEMLIAVSYLRMGPWEHTGMSVEAVTRQQWLDDVTNSVGETFLAAGMSCCRCHDHKFDPLPTRDYYRFQAVFAAAQFADRDVPLLPAENTRGLEEGSQRVEHLLASKNDDLRLAFNPADTDKQREEAKLALKKLLQKREEALRREAQRFKPLAMSIYNGPLNVRRANIPYHPLPKKTGGPLQDIFVLAGGSLESPGEKVSPGVLSAAYPEVSVPNSAHGRRLALARWIASKENPRTARVIVNRIWQQHFGRAIAPNPNNFGKMGGKPSHPELLDWLASEFVEQSWSVKKLHRLIMTSEAYQRDGKPKDAHASERIDPDNRLLGWHSPRRLTAEELRDEMLATSGELNPESGGLPGRPTINLDIAFQPRHVMGSIAPAYQPSRTPAERNRRTVYCLKIRTLRDPLLEVFDQPSPDLSCERRRESTVTPQVFALFNGQASHDRALALALRLEREAATPSERINRAFQRAVGRSPSDDELRIALAHLQRMTDYHRQHETKAIPLPTRIERALIEEQTGTRIRWEERLDVYENYVADVCPADMTPEMRALADFCLVLFNTNEFAYVY